MDNGKLWVAPLTGVLFVALLIGSFAIGGEPPAIDESAQEIVDFYVDNDSEVMFGAALQTAAAALFVFFGGYLYRVLRDAPGASGAAALVTFAGTVIFATGVAIDGTISFALAETAEDIDPTAVQALAALWQNDFLPFVLGIQVFLLALGVSVVRHGALPKWLGWIALVLGVIALIPHDVSFAAVVGAGILILIISVLLASRARSGGASAARAA